MTSVELGLCSVLLKERYGSNVQKVGTYLMAQIAPQPLIFICKNVSLSKKEVKQAVKILLIQSLAQYFTNAKGIVEISVKCEWVLNLLFHIHCTLYCKERFGDMAELLVDDVCFESAVSMSKAIDNVIRNLHQSTGEDVTLVKVTELQKVFELLIEKRIVCRGYKPGCLDKERTPFTEKELYAIPEINPNLLVRSGAVEVVENPAKKAKTEEAKSFPDSNIFWVPNWERIECYLRNELIVKAAAKIVDENASRIIRIMLELSETTVSAEKKLYLPTSSPVSYHDIIQQLKKNPKIDYKILNSYLAVLKEGDYCFIAKADERSGGMYVVNIAKIIQKLAEDTVSSVIQERYGSDYSRIFRLLLRNKYLEQTKLEEIALLPQKEVKQYTYTLMREHFVTTQEIAKTPDYAPTRTLFLFYVDLFSVCQQLLSECQFSMRNLLTFLMKFKKDNQRLCDRKARVNIVVAALQQDSAPQEQIDELMQMITPVEKEELEKIQTVLLGLNVQIIEIIDMILLLKVHLKLTPCK